MKLADRTRFHDLEDRIKIESFLAQGEQRENPYARILVQTIYSIMRRLEWPNDQWALETTLNGKPRPFFSADMGGLGIMLTLTVDKVSSRVSFVLYSSDKRQLHRFSLNGRRLGDFAVSEPDSFSSLTKAFEDAVFDIAFEQLAQQASPSH